MVVYIVKCEFTSGDQKLADRWLRWLREEHIREVLAAGARSADIRQLSAEIPTYEVHYAFASPSDYQRYESEFAPGLRAEGLKRFPLELGLKYTRRTEVPQG